MKLTKKGKRCLFFVLVAALFAIVAALSIAASASDVQKEYVSHIVSPEDTLWDIAETYGTNDDVRKTVYEIKKLNQMESSEMIVGTELLIAIS